MTTFVNETKNSSTFANISKTFGDDMLLLETGDYILLEDGYKIDLEQAGTTNFTSWSNETKN
jgi:hypothetical protein